MFKYGQNNERNVCKVKGVKMTKNEIISFLLRKNNNSWKETIIELLDVISLHEKKLTALENEKKALKTQLITLEAKLLAYQPTPKWWLESLRTTEFDVPEPPDTEVVSMTPLPTANEPEAQCSPSGDTYMSTTSVATIIGTPLDTTTEKSPF